MKTFTAVLVTAMLLAGWTLAAQQAPSAAAAAVTKPKDFSEAQGRIVLLDETVRAQTKMIGLLVEQLNAIRSELATIKAAQTNSVEMLRKTQTDVEDLKARITR